MVTPKKKAKVGLVSTENELIQQLSNTEYIKNPLVYSQIRGDFSLIQTNVLVQIAATMQTRINEKFINGKMGPLFSKEELSKGKITFEVPLQSLGVKTKEYPAVHEACKGLTKLDTTFTYVDENGEKRNHTSVIFTDVDVPTYTTTTGVERRSGIIKIDMNATVAEQIFNQSGAYVEHIGGIVKLCRSPRTPRLYIYLSAWKNQRMCIFKYNALKEFLGVLIYSKDRTRIIQDKCTSWAVFHRDVLKPAQREMEKLANRGEIEFSFEYEPVYHNGKKRGNPDCVRFFLVPGHPEAAIEEKVEDVEETLQSKYAVEWKHLENLLRERVGNDFVDVYFEPCSLNSIDDKYIVVNVPSSFVLEQWNRIGGADLIDSMNEIFGRHSLQFNITYK